VPVNGAQTFTAKVGLATYTGTQGSVIFQVWDGTTKLADSGIIRGGQAPTTMTVNVAGRSQIRLVVTDAGNGRSKDHANWADAQLHH
jgi:hypothetical protein